MSEASLANHEARDDEFFAPRDSIKGILGIGIFLVDLRLLVVECF